MRLADRRRLIGVIDLLGGVAVRAVGGRRDEYRPVESRLCDSPDPLRIAKAYRESFGIESLYVADLDAILGGPPNLETIARLADEGFRLTVDAGLRSAADAADLFELNIEAAVAGLETLSGPQALVDLIRAHRSTRVIFGLDLEAGVPLADPETWGEPAWDEHSPLRLACYAASLGAERFLVLDLRAVGTSLGLATADLCREIGNALPNARVWSGGGIRNAADVYDLFSSGVERVLVASALHDGTLTP